MDSKVKSKESPITTINKGAPAANKKNGHQKNAMSNPIAFAGKEVNVMESDVLDLTCIDDIDWDMVFKMPSSMCPMKPKKPDVNVKSGNKSLPAYAYINPDFVSIEKTREGRRLSQSF